MTEMGTGQFWFKGITPYIKERLSAEMVQQARGVKIDVNIDGLDLYEKGKSGKMWPILGSFCDFPEEPVFIIAAYCGEKKPADVIEFLSQFRDEVESLENDGIRFVGLVLPFKAKNYILDAPARAFCKCIIEHNGEKGCEKCEVKGEKYKGREVFCDYNALLRTDESFTD